jgi:hypothetical protein
MDTTLQTVLLNVPPSDIEFAKQVALKMGWRIDDRETLWERFIRTRPKNVPLTDDDIMEEVRAVRYGEDKARH